LNRGLEDLESGTPRRSKAARQNPARDRGALPWFERRNRAEPAAIFIPQRKPVEKVFERDKTGAFEVGGASRADALQVLQGGPENLFSLSRGPTPAR
jgi:hypothetical protein